MSFLNMFSKILYQITRHVVVYQLIDFAIKNQIYSIHKMEFEN